MMTLAIAWFYLQGIRWWCHYDIIFSFAATLSGLRLGVAGGHRQEVMQNPRRPMCIDLDHLL